MFVTNAYNIDRPNTIGPIPQTFLPILAAAELDPASRHLGSQRTLARRYVKLIYREAFTYCSFLPHLSAQKPFRDAGKISRALVIAYYPTCKHAFWKFPQVMCFTDK